MNHSWHSNFRQNWNDLSCQICPKDRKDLNCQVKHIFQCCAKTMVTPPPSPWGLWSFMALQGDAFICRAEGYTEHSEIIQLSDSQFMRFYPWNFAKDPTISRTNFRAPTIPKTMVSPGPSPWPPPRRRLAPDHHVAFPSKTMVSECQLFPCVCQLWQKMNQIGTYLYAIYGSTYMAFMVWHIWHCKLTFMASKEYMAFAEI